MAVRAALQPMVGGSLARTIIAQMYDRCKHHFRDGTKLIGPQIGPTPSATYTATGACCQGRPPALSGGVHFTLDGRPRGWYLNRPGGAEPAAPRMGGSGEAAGGRSREAPRGPSGYCERSEQHAARGPAPP